MLDYERRMLIKKVSNKEPMAWKWKHHMIRVYINTATFMFCFRVAFEIGLKSDVNNHLGPLKNWMFKRTPIVLGFGLAQYFNYWMLDDYVYDECYAHLTDSEVLQVYESTWRSEIDEEYKL